MSTYIGKAPLSLVRAAGSITYVYAGQPAPEGIADDDLVRLLDEGYLVEIPDELVPDVVPAPDDPGTGSPGTQPTTVIRPPNVANKAAWLDYRVGLGQITPEQRAGIEAGDVEVTVANLKDDAFMDDWPTLPGEVEHADGSRSAVLRDAVDEPDTDGADPAFAPAQA